MSPALLRRAEEAAADAVPRARDAVLHAAESFAVFWDTLGSRPALIVDEVLMTAIALALRATTKRYKRAQQRLSTFSRAHREAKLREAGLRPIRMGWA